MTFQNQMMLFSLAGSVAEKFSVLAVPGQEDMVKSSISNLDMRQILPTIIHMCYRLLKMQFAGLHLLLRLRRKSSAHMQKYLQRVNIRSKLRNRIGTGLGEPSGQAVLTPSLSGSPVTVTLSYILEYI